MVGSGGIPPPYQAVATPLPPTTVDHLQGVVVSSLDGKPVPRVLVTTLGNQGLAVLTDYEGRFSFDLRRPLRETDQPATPATAYPTIDTTTLAFNLRKPEYTATTETATVPRFTPSGPEPEIRLPITPAGLIFGRVTASTPHLPPFLSIQLRRRTVNDGTALYTPITTVQPNASGEYRFPELAPGDYKITTQGSPDYGPLRGPHPEQPDTLPGLLPAAYPDASSVDAATPIHISPGQTVTANLALHTAPFYRVVIPISSAQGPYGVNATFTPESPGLSLTYDNQAHTLHGYLPAGTYTVRLTGARATPVSIIPRGPAGGFPIAALTASLTLHVEAPVRTDPVALQPAVEIPVDVRQDFTPSTESPVPVNASGDASQRPFVSITLTSVDSASTINPSVMSIRNPDGDIYLANVPEGAYRVRASTGSGYIASITCGGTDLLRDPLVVGPSGLNSPIEVALRNDSASLKITLDDGTLPGQAPPDPTAQSQLAGVSLIPLDSPQQQALFTAQLIHPPALFPRYGSLGQFPNLAPGRYLVIAIRTNGQPLVGLEYNNPKVLESLLARGTIVTLTPSQKAEVSIPVLPPEPQD